MNTTTKGFITIAGFEDFTAQHVFDMSARHLLSQKVRAFGEKPERGGVLSCLYDGPNHTTCAAGIFIRPEERHEADKGSSSWMRLVHSKRVPDTNATLIDNLQAIHDQVSDVSTKAERVTFWSLSLRYLAKRRSLNEDAIDEMLTGS